MKRVYLAGLAAVACIAGTGLVFGQDLVAGYRFQSALEADSKQQVAAGGAWPQVQATCNFCHGTNGQSANSAYAALTGQNAAYLAGQLKAFASGQRSHPQMAPLAASLDDAQIASLAKFYARQKPVRNDVVAMDPELDAAGKSAAALHGCASCHGDNFGGTPAAPRLAGQGEQYLAEQLAAFAADRRTDPAAGMNVLAKSLKPDDIRGLTHYLAGLDPKPGPAT